MRKLSSLIIIIAVIFFCAGVKTGLSGQGLSFCSSQKGLPFHSVEPPLQKSAKTLSRIYAHYIRGILYDNENETGRAIEEYLAAKALDNSVAAIHRKLAIDYIKAGYYKKAEEELRIIKGLTPEDKDIRRILAHFYTVQEMFTEACAEYEELLRDDPADLESLASLADLYVIQEKIEEAISIYQKILDLKPDSVQVHFNLGIIYTKSDRLDDAETEFEKVLELDPDFVKAELALALLNEVKQDYTEAIKHYQQALKIDPLNINVYYRLAQTYYEDKRVEEAISQYEFILEMSPYEVDAYIELAYIYLNEQKTGKCIEILEQALAQKDSWETVIGNRFLTPEKKKELQGIKETQVYLILGLAYTRDGENGKAIEAYKNSIQSQPENDIAYFYLGALYERNGQRQEAYNALEKSVELNDENPDALNYLGYMYADDGINLDRAQELIENALVMEPGNGAYLDSLGWVYFKKGMLDEALEQIKKASEILEDAEILEHLGDIYQVKGDSGEMKKAWERALELDPERKSVREKLEKLNTDYTNSNNKLPK